VTTVLQYLVIAAVIGLVVFGLAVVVFGRGEQLAPLSPRSSPTELPDRGIEGSDVRAMKFAMAVRGYRMSDVDWALERMASEVDRLRAGVRELGGDPDLRPTPDDQINDPSGETVSDAADELAPVGPTPAGHIADPTDGNRS
jgi:DivIVA domain-containing protein